MGTKTKMKPEIGYNHKAKTFEILDDSTGGKCKPITIEQARERWDAVDSDWTAGAYSKMVDTVIKENGKKKAETQVKIAERFEAICAKNGVELTGCNDRLSTMMDLDAVDRHLPGFDWEGLLAADDLNFAHDLFGIKRHIDRPNDGVLTGGFLPRFAR